MFRLAIAVFGIVMMSVGAARADQALIDASREGDVVEAVRLIAEGVSLEVRDRDGRTPLLIAVREDRVELVRLLIEAGADVNAKDAIRDTPFLFAGAEGKNDALRLILESGRANLRDINRYGGTALIPAAHHGHPETVRLLLQTAIDVDHINDLGWTALMEAVILGDDGATYEQIVRLLVTAGARDLPDKSGKTALEHARTKKFDRVAAAIEAGSGR